MNQAAPPRQRTEEIERASLSTWATLAADSKGRERAEPPDRLRTVFQQDRDRIVHAAAFHRLRDKTHAVIAPERGRRRYRITHTLEVSQIGRTIARALRLNEDLVEAIALGHDLGHTAFGASGEEALAIFDGFRHPEQSLRVVEHLERAGQGLNLTWEVRDGIVNHTTTMPSPATLEGQVVRLSNQVASVTHDLDDALQAGVVSAADVGTHVVTPVGQAHGQRVAALVEDIVQTSEGRPEVAFSPKMTDTVGALNVFLEERIHGRSEVRAEHVRASHCLRSLGVFYLENPDRLPAEHQGSAPIRIRIKDHLSGLTDSSALGDFRRLFVPAGDR